MHWPNRRTIHQSKYIYIYIYILNRGLLSALSRVSARSLWLWLECWRVAPPPPQHLVSLKSIYKILLQITAFRNRKATPRWTDLKRNVFISLMSCIMFCQIWRVQMSAWVCHITERVHEQITQESTSTHFMSIIPRDFIGRCLVLRHKKAQRVVFLTV